jgi:serine/threonine-protein kinase
MNTFVLEMLEAGRLDRKLTAGNNRLNLRSSPLSLNADELRSMLTKWGFFDSRHYPGVFAVIDSIPRVLKVEGGVGIGHAYVPLEKNGDYVVIDFTTSLMWQQSGSSNEMRNVEATEYIRDLNKKHFAGYNDWRLSTLEEAMSLMEPQNYGELHIDPVFDERQRWIWTADKASASEAWYVYFQVGSCYYYEAGKHAAYVRAVRSGQ